MAHKFWPTHDWRDASAAAPQQEGMKTQMNVSVLGFYKQTHPANVAVTLPEIRVTPMPALLDWRPD